MIQPFSDSLPALLNNFSRWTACFDCSPGRWGTVPGCFRSAGPRSLPGWTSGWAAPRSSPSVATGERTRRCRTVSSAPPVENKQQFLFYETFNFYEVNLTKYFVAELSLVVSRSSLNSFFQPLLFYMTKLIQRYTIAQWLFTFWRFLTSK